ncbi:MAG: malectin domain-containing carbohydrate-binding protein [Lentisphaerales bacterium]|nr:malectin domain-containing carbohydrate-binding protein [Lentisphaerales bacterium]
MKKALLSLWLLSLITAYASDTKHIEMDYGNILSMSVEADGPEDQSITHKALVFKMATKALPEKGTPIGKGRFIKISKGMEDVKDKELYMKQRERLKGYLIAVPDGKYKVTLKFAEIKRKNAGERVFDILFQQKLVRKNFDAFKEAGGMYKPIDLTFDNIDVKKFLRLEFTQKSTRSTPAVAAIIIEGENYTQRINCGGEKYNDFDADWDKNTYSEDPFTTGLIFDTELMRISSSWINGFVKLKGTAYDATHGSHPEIEGDQVFASGYMPGWVPAGEEFADNRKHNLGNLAVDWTRFKGFYRTANGPVLKYTVGQSEVLEKISLLKVKGEAVSQAYLRNIESKNWQGSAHQLLCEVEVEQIEGLKFEKTAFGGFWTSKEIHIAAQGNFEASSLKQVKRKIDGEDFISLYLNMTAPGMNALLVTEDVKAAGSLKESFSSINPTNLSQEITKFSTNWTAPVKTEIKSGENEGMLTVDEITLPDNNPWRSWMRPGAFDFYNGGKSLAVSTWSGDVWLAQDITGNEINWKRFAAGLFHPLGLKVVDELIYVQCRDGIYKLHDLNGDNEADFHEVFNNDVLVTVNFHEFSFELHRDTQGNFYFVKGAPVKAGGEGFDIMTHHHGSLFKISPDGKKFEVIATGFRAPNGMGMSPKGQITTSDNEGNWVAATPINWVEEGGFYGVQPTAHKEVPEQRSQMLCWIPHEIDNSAGGQVWIPEGKWGNLGGQMVHISYGQAKIFNVLKESVEGNIQGGVYDLKPNGGFDAGIMRGRFNDKDSALYLCGLKGWQTKGVKDGGLYRVRYLGKEKCMPTGLSAGQNGLKISFNEKVDPVSALDAGNYDISQWVYEISSKYGSRRYKVPTGSNWDRASEFSPVPVKELAAFNAKKFDSEEAINAAKSQLYEKYVGEDTVKIKSISLSDDGKTVFLEIPDIAPVMQIKTSFNIKSATGARVKSDLYHTIHKLGNWKGKPGKAATSVELDKPQPGIVVKYTHRGQQKSDVVVQRLAAFHIPEKTAVTQFLDHGPFDARMDGYVEAARNMPVEIFTAGKGKVTISINGKVVCKDVEAESTTIYPTDLKKGFNKLLVEYSAPATGDASFRLYWRSNAYFPKEPIPPTSLYHEAGQDEVVKSRLLRHGLELAIDSKCFSCHTEKDALLPELKDSQISLTEMAKRLNPAWITSWLRNPKDMRQSARMPAMLKNLPEHEWEKAARDISAYLTDGEKAHKKAEGSLEDGQKLFADLGCASCHAFKEDDLDDNMISLEYSDFKFKPGYMAEFLQNPQKHNPQSRMPNFGLSEDEAKNLEVYIRSKAKKMMSAAVIGDANSGKSYFDKLNCASCHNGTESKAQTVASLFDKTGGCLIGAGNGKPKYTFNGKEKEALAYFLKNGKEAVSHNQPIEFTARQLKNLNCNNCHGLDHSAANWKSPNVKPSDLPPAITHAGEKVMPAYMKKIFLGETEKMRPWQVARMPAFKTQAHGLAEGLAAMHGFGPGKDVDIHENLEVGDKLSKTTGFACVVCHAIGSTKALAPFGAPGLNLELSAERLRYDYYMRWMLNPQRVIPSTHMTRFSNDHKTTALPDLKGDADAQFKAIWSYVKSLK